MCGRKNETAYLADMVEACERVIVFASGVADDDLMDRSAPLRGAVLHQLTILGEAAKYIDDERRLVWPTIPWADMTGMRDKLVHYYKGIDDEMVCLTIRTSIPEVLPQLRSMLAEMDAERDGGVS